MAPVPMRIGDVLLLVAAPSHRAIPSPTRQSQALLRLAGPFAFHFVAAYVVSANWSLCDTASCVGGWSDPARGAPPCAARSVLALRGGSLELQLPERDAELLPPVDVDGEDANGGLWRWEMPDENTALRAWGDALEDYTADSPRKCMYCQETMVVQGVSAAALNGSWVAFFCRECAPHLSVRKNAQVPVTWGAEANETLGLLTMLPLYKRCRRCRRWATWGPKTHPRRALHCKAHKLPLEEDVVHRRHLCQAENCTRRPSFAEPSHKVDIEHERCRGGGTRLKGPHGPSTEVPFRDAPMPFLSERQQPATSRQVCRQTHRASSHIIRSAAQDRCHNQPIYRAPGAAYPTMCEEHRTDPSYERVIMPKCRHRRCGNPPVFCSPGTTVPRYCAEHKQDGFLRPSAARPFTPPEGSTTAHARRRVAELKNAALKSDDRSDNIT